MHDMDGYMKEWRRQKSREFELDSAKRSLLEVFWFLVFYAVVMAVAFSQVQF